MVVQEGHDTSELRSDSETCTGSEMNLRGKSGETDLMRTTGKVLTRSAIKKSF